MKRIFRAVVVFSLVELAPLLSLFAQSPDLVLNPGSSYVDAGRGVPWGATFNRTYVLVPNSPNASLCIYVVNNNPTNAHSFTTQVFQTADSQATDFSNNQGRYNSVTVNSMPASIAANTMGAGFVQSTAAAKIAVKFSASATQAGSPDTADVFLVQTTTGTCGSASIAIAVQGPIPVGSPGTTNPVIIGGIDASGNVRSGSVLQSGVSGSGVPGLAIGTAALSIPTPDVSYSTSVTTPNASGGGPLVVGIVAASSSSSMTTPTVATDLGSAIITQPCTVAGKGCPGLYVADAGLVMVVNQSFGLGTTNVLMADIEKGHGSVVQTCRMDVQIANSGGTTPTADVYLQDGADNILFTDRIHFPQVTTGSFNGWATLSGMQPQSSNSGATNTLQAITTQSNHTLAANTLIQGAISKFVQLSVVIGGTSPSYNIRADLTCK